MRVMGSEQTDKGLGRDPEQSPTAASPTSRDLAMPPSRDLPGHLEGVERLGSCSVMRTWAGTSTANWPVQPRFVKHFPLEKINFYQINSEMHLYRNLVATELGGESGKE